MGKWSPQLSAFNSTKTSVIILWYKVTTINLKWFLMFKDKLYWNLDAEKRLIVIQSQINNSKCEWKT